MEKTKLTNLLRKSPTATKIRWQITVLLFLSILITGCSSSTVTVKPLKVYILAGQSNMQGHAKTATFDYMALDPVTAPILKEMRNADGSPRVCDKVWISAIGVSKQEKQGKLTVGYGAENSDPKIGPEFTFGIYMQKLVNEPILIIKTAWGGKSLAVDFRPPSSGPYQIPKEKLDHWRKNQGKHGVPNIEKYTADIKKAEGHYYREMMTTIKTVIANLDTDFPELKGHAPVFTGFGWHQGWNDGCDKTMVAEYEKNMANFINDVRKDLGVKDLPFVIANTGQNGLETKGAFATLCQMQLDMGDPKKHPEFKGTVSSVETRGFKRTTEESPSGFGYHWNHSGESHYLVGDAMGKAMVKLLEK
jgi:hypothetical protein